MHPVWKGIFSIHKKRHALQHAFVVPQGLEPWTYRL